MANVVLITGGTAGIGLALAEAFLARGSTVVVCGRSQPALDRFAREHPGATAIKADVTNGADRAAMLDAIVDYHGALDILVNNAGMFVDRDFTAGPSAVEHLEGEMALNLTAPIQLTAEVLQRWPSPEAILFVTSGYALVSPTRAPTYGAAKAGLHAFAEALRRQLAPIGTHVLELLPPMTDTRMNAASKSRKMSPQDVAAVALRALDRKQPMALPGPVKLMPAMLRIAPRYFSRFVGAT